VTETGNRLLKLAEGLLGATRAGRARWRRADTPDTYVLATQTGTVTVSGPRAYPALVTAAEGYLLRVTDNTGNPVVEISTSPVVAGVADSLAYGGIREHPTNAEVFAIADVLRTLLQIIPVTTTRADEVAEGILRDLGQ